MKSEAEIRKLRFISRWKQYGVGYLFMLPWIVGFLVFMAFPLVWSLYLSFNKVRLSPKGFKYEWIGFGNLKYALFQDNVYPIQLISFFQAQLLMIPMILIFSFFIAILLNQQFKGRFLFRAVFFLPVIFSTGQVLMELFTQGAGELPFISQYHVDVLVTQYISERMAAPLLSVLSRALIILWYSGVQILIFLAGFQTISKSIYEAVRIDGASPWESFWKITLPTMLPFISLNLLYTIVDLFTFPLNPVMTHIRSQMFQLNTGYGYASAIAWFYFVLILVFLGFALWLVKYSSSKRGGNI